VNSIAQPGARPGANQSRHFVQIVAATAALAGLLFGFDTGVISGAVLFIKSEFGLTPFAEEVLVSAALVGAVVGSTLSGPLTDTIGRKRAILITAVIFTFGSILCAIATNTLVLITGRIAIGVAIGVASYTAPLYIGEMAPPNLRGALSR
jgi:SP family galactose:H+ symporter-like MFS transporter